VLQTLVACLKSEEPTIVADEAKPDQFVVLSHLTLEQTTMVANFIELVTYWSLVPALSFFMPSSSRNVEYSRVAALLPKDVSAFLKTDLSLPLKALQALNDCLQCRELVPLINSCALMDMIPAFVRLGFERTNLPSSDVQWANATFKLLISNSPSPTSSVARILFLHLSLKLDNPVAVRVLSSSLYMLLCERNDGLIGVLSSFLDTSSGQVDLEVVAMAAKTIACPPERIQIEPYMQKLCPQLLALLRAPHAQQRDKYLATACEIFRIWSHDYPSLTTRYWLAPCLSTLLPFLHLFLDNQHQIKAESMTTYLSTSTLLNASSAPKPTKQPLIQVLDTASSSEPTQAVSFVDWSLPELATWNTSIGAVVTHTIIEKTVSNVSLLLFSVGDESYLPQFEPILPIVVNIYSICIGKKPLEKLEKQCIAIIQRFFTLSSPDRVISMLTYLVLFNNRDWRHLFPANQQCMAFELAETSSGQLSVLGSLLDSNPSNDVIYDARGAAMQLVDVLRVLDGDIAGVFFLQLLSDLFTIMTITKSLTSTEPSSSTTIFSLDQRLELVQHASERQIRIIHVLLPLIEHIGPSVLRNSIQICIFIKSILESGTEEQEEELQGLVLSILMEILESKLVSVSESDILLVDLLSPLRTLFTHSNEFVSKLAQHCFEEITKYRQTTSSMSTDNGMTENPESAAETSDIHRDKERHRRKWVLSPHARDVEEALKMISNPLVPIRAGGLIQLRRFILREDSDTVAKLPMLLDTITSHLSNDDSYVYLGAIQGLSAIADVQFDLCMPKLIQEYGNRKRSLEVRLNVGESILQVARRLGQVLPKYASVFFSFLLSSAQRDPEGLMRASSLSNIGELCEMLRFGLLPYIEELMAMIYDILTTEKDEHVRRGCVNLVRQLFRGLAKDILLVIPDHLRRLRGLLEAMMYHDSDVVVREHARLAMEMYESGIQEAIGEAARERQSRAFVIDPDGSSDSLLNRLKFL